MKPKMRRVLGLAIAVVVASLAQAQTVQPFHAFLLQLLDVRPGMTVADVGAGRGDFALLLADAVGPNGRVYANEISQDKVDQIEKAKRERGASNVTAVLGEEDDPRLPDKVDYLVMVQVFHHLSMPDVFMRNVARYLKPNGRLVVTAVLNKRNPQAKPRSSPPDPCVSDPEDTRKAIEKAGFVFEKIVMHDDPNPQATWPTSYALVFSLPQTAAIAR